MNKRQAIAALLRRQGDSSVSALARKIGVSQPFLSRVISGKTQPTPKVLKYLGLKKVKTVKYVRAGK